MVTAADDDDSPQTPSDPAPTLEQQWGLGLGGTKAANHQRPPGLEQMWSIPTTRGDSHVDKWLSIDPRHTRQPLWQQRYHTHDSLAGVRLKAVAREAPVYFSCEAHDPAEVVEVIFAHRWWRNEAVR